MAVLVHVLVLIGMLDEEVGVVDVEAVLLLVPMLVESLKPRIDSRSTPGV